MNASAPIKLLFALPIFLALQNLWAQDKWAYFSTDVVYSRPAFKGDSIWYGTLGSGVSLILPTTNDTYVFNSANSDLPSNYVHEVKKGIDGTIWFVAGSHLCKFEEGHFVTNNNTFGNDHELLFDGNIQFDTDGNLYIHAKYYTNTSSISGIFRIFPDGTIEQVLTRSQVDVSASLLGYQLTEDNAFWVPANHNEKVFRVKNNEITTYSAENAPLFEGIASPVIEAPSGDLYFPKMIDSGNGEWSSIQLSRFNEGNWDVFTLDSLTNTGNSHRFRISFFDINGDLLLPIKGERLVRFDGNDFHIEIWPSDWTLTGMPSKALHMIADDGSWWGVGFHPAENRLYRYKDGTTINYSLSSLDISSNNFNDIFVDKSGNIWVAAGYSIARFDGLEWTGYADELFQFEFRASALAQDAQGNIWATGSQLGSPWRTFSKYDGEEWSFYSLDYPFNQSGGTDLYLASDSTLWATTSAGLAQLTNNSWTINEGNNDLDFSISRKIESRKAGGFYFSTNEQFFVYDGDGIEALPLPYAADQFSISNYFEDQLGILWIFQSNSITIYDGTNFIDATDQFPEVSVGHITDGVQDSNGVYWFGTCGMGLLRYDQEDWSFVSEGLPDGCILDVESDSLSNIWSLVGAQGITVYNENGINKLAPGLRACLRGAVFLDTNENGIREEGEYPLSNQKLLLLPDSTIKFSSLLGNYQFRVPANSENYTVKIRFNEADWILTSDSSNFTYDLGEHCIDSLNFGLYPKETKQSGTVDFTPGMPRCFQTTPAWLKIRNTGFFPLQGVYTLQIPEQVELVASNPEPVNNFGHTYHWDVEDIQPFGQMNISLELNYPGVDFIGDTMTFEATLLDIDDEALDTRITKQVIICSYDPNDKSVQPTGPSIDQYTLIEDELEYLIRFENKGNDTAFQVVIQDTLSPWLSPESFRLVSASHPVETELRGRLVTFTFEDIQLPYTNIDPIGSHGFVKFRITPLAHTPDYQMIDNKAFIYFDFNPPIITNTVQNTLVEALPSTSTETIGSNTNYCLFNFYPNPSYELIKVVIPQEWQRSTFQLFNTLGQRVKVKTVDKEIMELDGSRLPKGVYFYRFDLPDQACSGKVIFK